MSRARTHQKNAWTLTRSLAVRAASSRLTMNVRARADAHRVFPDDMVLTPLRRRLRIRLDRRRTPILSFRVHRLGGSSARDVRRGLLVDGRSILSTGRQGASDRYGCRRLAGWLPLLEALPVELNDGLDADEARLADDAHPSTARARPRAGTCGRPRPAWDRPACDRLVAS